MPYSNQSHKMKPARNYFPKSVATIIYGVFLVVASSTILSWVSLGPARVDPLLVVAVASGFLYPLALGSALVAFLAVFVDLLSGGVLGLNVFGLLIVVVLCSAIRRKLAIDSWPFQVLMVFFMSLISQGVVFAGLLLLGRPSPSLLELLLWFASQAMLTALAAPLFIMGLVLTNRVFIRLFSKIGLSD